MNFERHFCVTTYVKSEINNQYLMIFHKKLKKWLPPGGHVDLNEKPEDAAVRECLEETGLNVELLNPVAAVEGGMPTPYGIQLNVVKPGEHEHMDLIYLAKAKVGEALVLNESETEGLRWFTAEEILDHNFNTFVSVKQWVTQFSAEVSNVFV